MQYPVGTGGRRGAALVEFALVVPLILLLFLGIVEFALIGHHKLTLVQAARAGVREASIGRPLAAINEKTRATAPGMGVTDGEIVVEYNSQPDGNGSWLLVEDTADGTANMVPYSYLVRVRIAGWPHQMITGSFFSWLPGVSNGQMLLSGQMAMRRE